MPVLDLTTHGLGIDGARLAAIDLIRVWIEEKKAHGEPVKLASESFHSIIEIDDAVFSP